PRYGAKQRILGNILNSQPPAPAKPIEHATTYTIANVNIWEKTGQLTRIAAILLVAFSLSWLAFPPQKTTTIPILAEEIPLIQKSTAPGEKLQVTLSDGTRVWINSVSKLEFPEQFDSKERLVRLFGEAFFEVGKDSLRPFKVVANGTVTT